MLRGSPISTRSVGTGVSRLLYGVRERDMRQRGKDSGGRRLRGTQPKPHVSAMEALAVGTSYHGREAAEDGQLTGTDDVGLRA